MFHNLQDLVPPIIVKRRQRSRSDRRLYSSFEEASRHCGTGYDSDLIAEVVVAKTELFAAELGTKFPTLALGALRTLTAPAFCDVENPLRVLDFGGAAGFHYFLSRAAAPTTRQFDWRVVETPAMVRAASKFACNELSFFDRMADARTKSAEVPDIVFASGVLMCLSDPLQTLRDLLAVGAKRVFLTRTGFSSDRKTRTIIQKSTLADNGPGALPVGFSNQRVAYPCTFVSIHDVETTIEASGYRIVLRLDEDKDCWWAGGVGIHQYGFLCESR